MKKIPTHDAANRPSVDTNQLKNNTWMSMSKLKYIFIVCWKQKQKKKIFILPVRG